VTQRPLGRTRRRRGVLLRSGRRGTEADGRHGSLGLGFPDVVRGLALARYSGEKTVYLFYCDEESNVVSDTAHSSVEEAIDQARFEFEGLEFEPLP
jgi:hypothetical protein